MLAVLNSLSVRPTLLCLAMTLLFSASAPSAEIAACETALVVVETDDPVLRTRICGIASDILPGLDACHLVPKRPVVFGFKTSLSTNGRSCLGLFHRESDQISLLTPESFSQAHTQSDFCEMIPEEAHFDSIVIHELVHAVLGQSPCADTLCRLDNEYIAYAIQLESMPQETRDLFLERYGPRSPDQASRVNGFFLEAAPLAFAAASWLHFTSEGNGCDLVGRIVRGEFTFAQEPW
jgi:hypothetical protein